MFAHLIAFGVITVKAKISTSISNHYVQAKIQSSLLELTKEIVIRLTTVIIK